MLTEWGRRNLRGFFEIVASVFHTLHVTPNTVTALGVILSGVVGVLISRDRLLAAGLLYMFAGSLDAIDGTLARLIGVRSRFGAFWDSTLDRLSEAILYSAIGYWAALHSSPVGVLLSFSALTTSFLVSYARGRAESLGIDTKVGFGTRVERYVVVTAALLLGYPVEGMAVVTILAGMTVIQRIYDVWRKAQKHP